MPYNPNRPHEAALALAEVFPKLRFNPHREIWSCGNRADIVPIVLGWISVYAGPDYPTTRSAIEDIIYHLERICAVEEE